MNQQIVDKITEVYRTQFDGAPLLVRAPGRINIIGEHTDYNDGFVLPAAVDQAICFAVGLSASKKCTLVSLDMNETYAFDVNQFERLVPNGWPNYLLGVVDQLRVRGYLFGGFNLVFAGDIPQGSGMSSSAALECGTAFSLNTLFSLGLDKMEMVKASQLAEHTYAGVRCGIMDQFASMMGKKDQALMLDCRSLEFNYFPMHLKDYSLLLCNSNVTHSLATSEYNVRRQQCEEVVQTVRRIHAEVNSLRDVSMEMLEQSQQDLSEVVFRRGKYIIEENMRVHAMTAALSSGDYRKAGEILSTAHQGMERDFEITCPEIDYMVSFASQFDGVLGARMMGGGFGGCTLNLISRGEENRFLTALESAYLKEFNKRISPVSLSISDGVGLIG